jgi:hypothetical protein
VHGNKRKHGRNKIIAFVSNGEIVQLYFPQGSGANANSHAQNHGMRIGADFFSICYVLAVFLAFLIK